MLTRVSPAEPGPGDAPAGVPVHAPVPRAGDGLHHVEPVRAAVVARSGMPRAAGVFHLDPEVVGVDLGAERELAGLRT